MRFRPKLPEHNPNIGRQRPLQDFLVLGGGILLIVGLIYLLLGLAIDKAITYISPEREQQWFQGWAPASTPSVEQETLQSLAHELQKCTTLTYPITVHFMDSNESNAVVFPGGTVLIYRGLLNTLDSENALAFVIAHELAHLQHRDHLRGMGRAVVLALLSSLLTGSHDTGALFLPATELGLAQHSQQRELAADAAALATVNCYYGHTGGAEVFFQSMLQQETRLLPTWFDSHPALQVRLDALKEKRHILGYTMKGVTPLPAALTTKAVAP